ncbi:MAG: DUF1919 domain-containing protein [Lachnospiraceae bacterium]|nr:DUF1919 domain-containing protein [Lachnospiraceae bacterium]
MLIIQRIYNLSGKATRKLRDKRARKRFHNPGVSIISSNCVAGVLYHSLNLQFRSPTINLWFENEDFIKFCEHLEHYLSLELTDVRMGEKEHPHPIGYLEDVKIYFLHYHSIEEAREKWNDRKKRVDFQNIRIIHTDRDGYTEALERRFFQLNYPKILYCSENRGGGYKGIILQRPDRIRQEQVGPITSYGDLLGRKNYEKGIDIIEFLNSGDCITRKELRNE